ncbi:MAG: hypothetical protein F6J97_25405, partial [Leptolyngbya sp. SIO4C1]|nr:hypothetical protein [Leptolyngbya sp. SIO4C1]
QQAELSSLQQALQSAEQSNAALWQEFSHNFDPQQANRRLTVSLTVDSRIIDCCTPVAANRRGRRTGEAAALDSDRSEYGRFEDGKLTERARSEESG